MSVLLRKRSIAVLSLLLGLASYPSRAAPGAEFTICVEDGLRSEIGDKLSGKLAKRFRKMPDRTTYKFTEKKATELFETARRRWLDKLDSEDLRKVLRRLADGDLEKLRKDDLDEIVHLRLRGLKLVETYRLFDESHEFPRELRRFIKQLGYLKDYMKNASDLDKKGVKKLRKQARKVLRLLEDVPTRKKDIDIDVASPASIEKFLRDTLAQAQELASAPSVKARDYHMVRKNLRRVRILFQLLNDEQGDATAAFVSKYLGDLIADMEVVHDDIVKRKIADEIDYENHTLKFPEPIRKRIQDFLNMVQ